MAARPRPRRPRGHEASAASGGATLVGSRALTVVIPAAGPVHPLLATLAGLARDPEGSCEILILDGGLEEPASLTAPSHADVRIRIRGGSLAEAVAEGTTPFLMILRPGDVVVPGALHAMIAALEESPDVGLAHAWWFPIDPREQLSRSAIRRHRGRMAARLPPALDHRRALVVQGSIVQALPTFRRAVLTAAGGLDGAGVDDAVYRAALRVLSRAEARVVPRLLCGRPRPAGRGSGDEGPRHYLTDLALCYRVVGEGGADYLRTPRYRFARLACAGLLRQVGGSLQRGWMEGVKGWARRLVERVGAAPPFVALARGPGPYGALVSLLGRWSFDSLRPERGRVRPAGGERVAYLLWRYPVLTETFVRREVHALRSVGLNLDVYALESPDVPVPEDRESPAGAVTYLGPRDLDRWRAATRRYIRRKPWTVLRLWLFVVRHRYRERKASWHDRDVLYMAAGLAEMMAERGTTHVHSPWANHSAFLAFLVSRLLAVTCSVQARASDIHRSAHAPLVEDRVRFAEFLITNSRYNESYLRSLLGSCTDVPIHTIYNGIELSRFQPPAEPSKDAPLRVLSVGRLVESKGFRYLLEACRLLRDRGLDFACEIIGGPQDPAETVTWIGLQRLHAELRLESTVRFVGAKPFSSVLSAYHRADIVVLPSVRAGDGSHDVTPNTLIEAMALRLPVVSTTIGAIPEIVDHEVDGLLVPPNDAKALAAALERLLGDPALRRRLGEAARRKVEERFDIDRNLEERAKLFWLRG